MLCHGSSEHAFLSLEVELMLAENVEDLYYNGVMLILGLAAKDEDAIHVNNHDLSSMSSWKISFIIIWNVARLLVRPKNMTRGLNRPRFV